MIKDADFYLGVLKAKFQQIDPKEYYLSYSGGKDSHLLYWFLKEWLPKHDPEMAAEGFFDIPIVAVNTRMEHPEILQRMRDNSDVVLLSEMKPKEIKEKYGIPVFTKSHDGIIGRYQRGSRRPYIMMYINGTKNGGKTMYKLNKQARELLLADKLPKVDNKCCDILKKRPMMKYYKETGLRPILGVRASESLVRKSSYTSCFSGSGKKLKFHPLWNISDQIFDLIYQTYQIETPEIYKILNQTGCIGCPYGCNSKRCETIDELKTLKKGRFNFTVDYFKEAYDILGIDYKSIGEEIDKKE